VVFENEVDRADFKDRDLLTTDHVYLIEGAGVDTDYFFPPPSRAPAEIPLAVLPARLLWEKGVGVLVEAMSLLPKETRLRVALVGEPDPGNPGAIEVGTLEAWHENGPVEWWGFRQDIRQVYWESDIVVLPTMYNEGVPTALMEAAACGLPLIATDIPGCRSVVANGHNGFLVPPNNSEALAKALDKLAKNATLRDRMGAAGRDLVLKRFTHQKINTQRLAVYKDLGGTQV
jgi:glycosyltransferase involved in cell wall biosynthesis